LDYLKVGRLQHIDHLVAADDPDVVNRHVTGIRIPGHGNVAGAQRFGPQDLYAVGPSAQPMRDWR